MFDFEKMFEEISKRDSEASKKALELLENIQYLPMNSEVKKAFGLNPASFLGFCQQKNIFEFFTQEYIKELAKILNKKKYKNIIEIGAGNGKLSYFLNKLVKNKIIATDSGEWCLNGSTFPVEMLGFEDALKKYKPDFVIISWIPRNFNIVDYIEKCDSIKGYLIIGVPEHCGTKELWKETNFYATRIEELCEKQICRLDIIGSGLPSESITTLKERRL